MASLSDRDRVRDLLLVIALVLHFATAIYVAWRRTAVDYPVYLVAAYGFWHGADVYSWSADDFLRVGAQLGIERITAPYLYPPLTALAALPFLALPYSLGLFIWVLINGAATIGSGLVLGKLADAGWRRVAIEGGTWLFVPFLASEYAGQVNPIVTLLAAYCVLALRREKEHTAGVALGLSMSFKPLALGLLLLAFWRRRWRFIATLAAAAAATLAACAIAFGSRGLAFIGSLSEWKPRGYPPAQNLGGTALRWLSNQDFGTGFTDRPRLAMVAALAASIGVGLVTMWVCRPPGPVRRWSTSEIAAVLAAVVLAHPRTWYHHYALLSVPLAAVVADPRRRSPVWWCIVAIAYVAIQIFGVSWHQLVGHRVLLECATFGATAIWILAARDRRREAVQAGAG